MFHRRADACNGSFSKGAKASRPGSSFGRDGRVTKRRHEYRQLTPASLSPASNSHNATASSPPAVVTLVVGLEQRVFAAREDVLSQSSFFHTALQNGLMDSSTRCIALADEEPHVFSAVLEYLYTGDYTPRMVLNSRRNSWELEQNSDRENNTCSFYHAGVDGDVLKDTAIYCAAYKYDLEGLRKLALRKQGLHAGIPCATILSSARYAYAYTPDTDTKLRAHYLALIIRSRAVFKRSGTMQREMFTGGTQLYFDLFVALANHLDDMSPAQHAPAPDSPLP